MGGAGGGVGGEVFASNSHVNSRHVCVKLPFHQSVQFPRKSLVLVLNGSLRTFKWSTLFPLTFALKLMQNALKKYLNNHLKLKVCVIKLKKWMLF